MIMQKANWSKVFSQEYGKFSKFHIKTKYTENFGNL
jgi:hypothetical protein